MFVWVQDSAFETLVSEPVEEDEDILMGLPEPTLDGEMPVPLGAFLPWLAREEVLLVEEGKLMGNRSSS